VSETDPRYKIIENQWAWLASLIPDLQVILTAPSLHQEIRRDFEKTLSKVDKTQKEIAEKRQPLIQKQLDAFKPKFENETRHLT